MTLSLAALAAISAIPGVAQAGLGAYQSIQAAKLRKENERPEFEIPGQITSATELARRQASRTKLPGQDIMEAQLGSQTAAGVSALKEVSDSPVDIAAGVTRLTEGQRRATNQLNISAEELRQRNIARLQSMLGTEAGFEVQKFQMNEYEPYLNAMKTAAALGAAGTQNIAGGLDSAGSGVLGVIGQNEMLDFMKSQPTSYDMWKMQMAAKQRAGDKKMTPLQGGIASQNGFTGIPDPFLRTPSNL